MEKSRNRDEREKEKEEMTAEWGEKSEIVEKE